MNNFLLLYGGGIDSTVVLHQLSSYQNVHAVHVDYGQKAAALEIEACSYFCQRYGAKFHSINLPLSSIANSTILNGSALANDVKTNVMEGRNLVLLSVAAMMASSLDLDGLVVGFHVEPGHRPFPDATKEFFEDVSRVLISGMTKPLVLGAPLSRLTRRDIFEYARRHDEEILLKAHTCYEAVPGGCGLCSHCATKAELLETMGD